MSDLLQFILLLLIGIVIGISSTYIQLFIHELGHAFVAKIFGGKI